MPKRKKSLSTTEAFNVLRSDFINSLGVVSSSICKKRRNFLTPDNPEDSFIFDVVEYACLDPKRNVRLLVRFCSKFLTSDNVVGYMEYITEPSKRQIFLSTLFYFNSKFYPNE